MSEISPTILKEDAIIKILAKHLQDYNEGDHLIAGRRAAILIPFLVRDNEWHLLFTRRSEFVNDHKGQVSFPGGAIDEQDDGPVAAALRETREEVGLNPNEVRVLGQLEHFPTVTRFVITPVVARIPWPFSIHVNGSEVSRVFSIPLSWLGNKDNYTVQKWQSPFGTRERVVFYKPYDGEQLWGITARITVHLLAVLNLLDEPEPY